MAIEVALNQQHSYHFNECRLERVLTAKTLDEASKMGLLDRIVDWFRGGVKREAIEGLYDQIAQPGHLTSPQVAQRFSALRSLVTEEHLPKFSMNVNDNGERWGMSLTIDGHNIYQTPTSDIDSQFYQVCAVKTAMVARDDLDKMSSALTLEKYIEGNIQCMSDDVEVQQYLRQKLDDPRFSAKHFTGIEEHDADPAKFVAKFGDTHLEFSNRSPTNGELRAEYLKDALCADNYTHLRTLVAKGFLTGSDNSLRYAVTPARYELLNLVGDQGMRDEGLARILYLAKVGNTNLGELFNLPEPLEAEIDDLDDFMLCGHDLDIESLPADVYADEAIFYQGLGQYRTTTIGETCSALMSQDLGKGLQFLAEKVNPHKLVGGLNNAFDYLMGRNSGAIALRNCITCAKAVDANLGLMLAKQQDHTTPLQFWDATDTGEGVMIQTTTKSHTVGLVSDQSLSSLLRAELAPESRAIISVPVSESNDSHAMNLLHFKSGQSYLVDGQNGKVYDLQNHADVIQIDNQYSANGRDIAPVTIHMTGDLPHYQ